MLKVIIKIYKNKNSIIDKINPQFFTTPYNITL